MKQSLGLIVIAAIIAMVTVSCASSAPITSSSFDSGDGAEEKSISIAEAVRDGYINVAKKIPQKRRIVVLGITGEDADEATWASDELLHLLVNAKRHMVVDRRGLDVELAEKKPSGEIEEMSVQDIGYLQGAEMVLYGNISAYQNQIRFLSLKVMDVRSGEIIAITSERFTAS
jgi:curli biogenesis system outer membrane secretion channel CsgG